MVVHYRHCILVQWWQSKCSLFLTGWHLFWVFGFLLKRFQEINLLEVKHALCGDRPVLHTMKDRVQALGVMLMDMDYWLFDVLELKTKIEDSESSKLAIQHTLFPDNG